VQLIRAQRDGSNANAAGDFGEFGQVGERVAAVEIARAPDGANAVRFGQQAQLGQQLDRDARARALEDAPQLLEQALAADADQGVRLGPGRLARRPENVAVDRNGLELEERFEAPFITCWTDVVGQTYTALIFGSRPIFWSWSRISLT